MVLPDPPLAWVADAAYLFGSRPRHSASWPGSVPAMGAQRRSIGGKSCLARYHSMSGLREDAGLRMSKGAKARLAALKEKGVSGRGAVVM